MLKYGFWTLLVITLINHYRLANINNNIILKKYDLGLFEINVIKLKLIFV